MTYNKEKSIHAIISKGGFMDAIKFGKFLASLRTEKKLTQEELAEKLFIDKRKVSRWECGMSIPDFETIIKLSEILNVTPYEFSICQRLEKEKLSKKVINKFKNIKDFKNYKLKKKILIILLILLGILFILTTIYTIKYYGKVEVYKLYSVDDKYVLDGIYLQANDYELCSINTVSFTNYKEDLIKDFDNCEFEIYENEIRLLGFKVKQDNTFNQTSKNSKLFSDGNILLNKYVNNKLQFKISCVVDKKHINKHSIDFMFIKKYDNKLF